MSVTMFFFQFQFESLRLALDGVPEGIDIKKVETVLSSDPDVLNEHHLHIWAISTTQTALTAHIVVKDITHMHEVKHRLKHDLPGGIYKL